MCSLKPANFYTNKDDNINESKAHQIKTIIDNYRLTALIILKKQKIVSKSEQKFDVNESLNGLGHTKVLIIEMHCLLHKTYKGSSG